MKKEKKCRECGHKFNPSKPLQSVCSYECTISLAKNKTEKENKKITVQAKKSMLTHSEWLKVLQVIFNTWIRFRDAHQPCISCGTTSQSIQYHAGHYYSVGSSPNLRFHPDNVHKQCGNNCNKNLHGNLIEYSDRLPIRIGKERFESLKELRGKPLKLSIPDIQEQIKIYKQKIKELRK